NAAPVEPAQLFGQRREDRQITGMQPCHVVSSAVGADKFSLDLVERQRRGIDDARVLRTKAEQLARHDRAGIKADWAARDQLASAHGDEIGRAGTGADEVHGHGAASDLASAQVAAPTTSLAAIKRDAGPVAARAAASASDGTPVSANTRSDRVCTRAPAALSSASVIGMILRPSVAAVAAIPGSAALALPVAIALRSAASIPAWASAARIAASMSAAPAPRRQPIPATIMALPLSLALPAAPAGQ